MRHGVTLLTPSLLPPSAMGGGTSPAGGTSRSHRPRITEGHNRTETAT